MEHRAHLLIWSKTIGPHLHRENTWILSWEVVLWVPKGGTPAVFHREYRFEDDRDLFTGPNAIAESEVLEITKMHPTPRPTWLYSKWLLLASEPGMLVLDPMMGSGPAAEVADDLSRKFVGYDLNEDWVRLTAKR